MHFRAIIALAVVSLALVACSGGNQQSQSTAAPQTTTAATAAPMAAAAIPTGTPNPTAKVQITDISGIYAENAIKQEAALGAFGTMTGAFNPYGTVPRAEYVRWLVTLSNIYFKDQPDKQIRLAEANSDQTFVDIPRSNPDFKYIQGMVNSGFVIGIDKTHFAPSRLLTREEMIAILMSRDANSSPLRPASKTGPPSGWNFTNDVTKLVDFTDRNKISKPYWGAFQLGTGGGEDYAENEVKRIFGNTKIFYPQKTVTRAEAAVALQQIDLRTSAGALGIPQ